MKGNSSDPSAFVFFFIVFIFGNSPDLSFVLVRFSRIINNFFLNQYCQLTDTLLQNVHMKQESNYSILPFFFFSSKVLFSFQLSGWQRLRRCCQLEDPPLDHFCRLIYVTNLIIFVLLFKYIAPFFKNLKRSLPVLIPFTQVS